VNGRIALRVIFSIVLIVLVLGGAAVLGWMAYNAGLAQGVAQNNVAVAPQASGSAAIPVYPFRPWAGPWYGFGFGPLACLFPLLFVFLVFALIRSVFWMGMGGHRFGGWGPRGPLGDRQQGFREMAEEWHRQAHSKAEGDTSDKSV
jgi:hypothetical protein